MNLNFAQKDDCKIITYVMQYILIKCLYAAQNKSFEALLPSGNRST